MSPLKNPRDQLSSIYSHVPKLISYQCSFHRLAVPLGCAWLPVQGAALPMLLDGLETSKPKDEESNFQTREGGL